MGIKIHHGPDGTFKTSGAIKDDVISVIKSGRTLVTNIRGFSRDNAVNILGPRSVHDNFNVIHVDTDRAEGREHLARFFHWAPKGAFFVIDEVQRIFPPSWREKQLKELDYPEPQDHLPEDKRRPEDIHTAWDMQRHHNWDFVFTTTNISKVHSMMRVMAKVAVRHVNVGIWRFYKTVEHGPESNGKNQADITSVKAFNFVPKKIFGLYASTTTGTFENSEPRTAFYKDPKIAALLFFVIGLWGYILSKPAPKVLGGDSQSIEEFQPETPPQDVAQIPQKTRPAAVNVPINAQHSQLDSDTDPLTLAANRYISQFDTIYVSGYQKSPNSLSAVFTGFKNDAEFQFNAEMLQHLGFKVTLLADCLFQIQNTEYSLVLFCKPTEVLQPEQKQEFNPQPNFPSVST